MQKSERCDRNRDERENPPHVRDEAIRRFLDHEDKRPGIGHRLLDDLDRAMEQIESDARFYPLVDDQPFGGAFREAHLLQNTYRLIFEIRTAEVVVVSLIHTHRRPGAWHRSLDEVDSPNTPAPPSG